MASSYHAIRVYLLKVFLKFQRLLYMEIPGFTIELCAETISFQDKTAFPDQGKAVYFDDCSDFDSYYDS